MSHTSKWFFSLVAVVVSSCSNNQQPTATAVGTTNIHGYVQLRDTALIRPYSGVTVQVEGSNISATSDDSGSFTLANVPTGVYNIRYSKPGYGVYRLMSQPVIGGGFADTYLTSVTTPVLQKIPNIIARLRDARFKDTAYQGMVGQFLIITGDITPDPAFHHWNEAVAMFVSHASDVSPYNAQMSFFLSYQQSYQVFDTAGRTFTFATHISNLASRGLQSGDSIYIVTYGSLPALYSVFYYDPSQQNSIFPASNQVPSPVIGVKIP